MESVLIVIIKLVTVSVYTLVIHLVKKLYSDFFLILPRFWNFVFQKIVQQEKKQENLKPKYYTVKPAIIFIEKMYEIQPFVLSNTANTGSK